MFRTQMVIASYDTSDQRQRRRFITYCKDFGLHRVQLSVFGGRLDRRSLRSLKAHFTELIDQGTSEDRLILVPLSRSAIKRGLMVHHDDERVEIISPTEAFREQQLEDWIL